MTRNKYIQTDRIIAIASVMLSLCFGIVSCTFSSKANSTSEEAIKMSKQTNDIASMALAESKKTNEIWQESNKIAQTSISISYIEKIFEQIYDKDGNENIMKLLKKRDSYTEDALRLWRIIDTFEWAGWQYCSGKISESDIRLYLGKSLENVCRNQQIIKGYGGTKNGLSILCDKFTTQSGFAKFLNKQNLHKCNFQ